MKLNVEKSSVSVLLNIFSAVLLLKVNAYETCLPFTSSPEILKTPPFKAALELDTIKPIFSILEYAELKIFVFVIGIAILLIVFDVGFSSYPEAFEILMY